MIKKKTKISNCAASGKGFLVSESHLHALLRPVVWTVRRWICSLKRLTNFIGHRLQANSRSSFFPLCNPVNGKNAFINENGCLLTLRMTGVLVESGFQPSEASLKYINQQVATLTLNMFSQFGFRQKGFVANMTLKCRRCCSILMSCHMVA